MKTIAVGIQNLYAPCNCACKYCLLQSCKKANGVDYYRGFKFAEKFVEWGKNKKLLSLPYYYISYCAEYPELFENISFNKSIGFIGATFLQCNGINLRTKSETEDFLYKLKVAGITNLDTTFYGDETYHDQFAARKGDYNFMMKFVKIAVEMDIKCTPSVVITEENKYMLDKLISTLSKIAGEENVHSFLPDYRGHGYLMEGSRLTEKSFFDLSGIVKNTINIRRYKTEKDWLSCNMLPEYTTRTVIITLRKDNIELLEKMSCDEIVNYIENLDDEYYNTIPTINELAQLYGDSTNTKLYRFRDLFWKWQKRYIEDNNIKIYNVTDERFCHTIRS